MSDSLYIEKGGKKLRCGYTTGSCAAAASKAALIMLLTGQNIHDVKIVTPKGPIYNAEILDISRTTDHITCAVIKDGGDDPDITSGALIYATVRLLEGNIVTIKGGEGVGVVTKPGLDQPVGEAAINSVPRRMIEENIREVLSQYGEGKSLGAEVIISVPKGKELAVKTFNPKLGIEGGISILGTTGIVEPMSDSAILETIRTEINVRKAEGRKILLAAPGNYGLTFLNQNYQIDESLAVMSSNFVYDTVNMAVKAGFTKMLFVGHIGKLVKVAGGIKNTHSMYGDHRMEILSDICRQFAAENEVEGLIEALGECVMTDEAVIIITEAGLKDKVFPEMANRIKEHMENFGENKLQVEVIVFSNEYTELVKTDNAPDYIQDIDAKKADNLKQI
jgi:cobalt-precorrin-5B (C1)-methyltransferase